MTMRRLLFLLVFMSAFCPATFGQQWAGIISPARATNWSNVGIPGGIPSAGWTQCGGTIAAYGSSGSPASPATINNALAACDSYQFVLLGPGNFYLSAGIDFVEKSHVVLRGAGANATFIHFTGDAGCNGFGAKVCLEGSNTYEGGGYTSGNWTAGYTQGATSITLDNVTGIVPNLTPIVLDQCNTGLSGSSCGTGSQTDNSNFYVCDVASVCESETAVTGVYRPLRAQEEVVIATGISGSGPYTVTLLNPLRNPNWSSSNTPQAWWGSATITDSGVENLEIDGSLFSSNGIVMTVAYECWVKGVASTYANGYHVFNYVASHNVVRDSYFYETFNAATQSYGVGGGVSGDLLFENNITQQVATPLSMDAACAGCVFGYNFTVDSYFQGVAYLFMMFDSHSAGQSMALLEGNIGSQVDLDDIHGTHNMFTIFRNFTNGFESQNNGIASGTVSVSAGSSAVAWVSGSKFNSAWTGTNPGIMWIYNPVTSQYAYYFLNMVNSPTSITLNSTIPTGAGGTEAYFVAPYRNTDAMHVASYMRYMNVIGNVFGTAGFHTVYQCVAPDTTTSPCANQGRTPYDIGYSSNTHGQIQNTGTTPYDDVIAGSTLMRWGNFDTVTNAVRWCGDSSDPGWVAICGSVSEIPTGDSYYPNAVPASTSLPPSFYYSSRPAWLPSSFPWPLIGPDNSAGNIGQCTGVGTPYLWSLALTSAQCTSGPFVSPAVAAHATANPAMACYFQMGGTPDGTGGVLSFNPSTCYATTPPGGGGAPPNPVLSFNVSFH